MKIDERFWRRPGRPWSVAERWAALITVQDYEDCARGASPRVRHVRVRAAANDPKMKPGVVEVHVRGPFRRRLPEVERSKVHAMLAAYNPIGVHLKVLS